MPSASMYASPWTYKEAPPKIKYPPMFSGLNKITFKHMLDSKILALSTLLLLITFVLNFLMAIMPFWFELVLSPADGTYGDLQLRERATINSGIFFLREDKWDNLVALDKDTSRDVVPKVLGFAQVCSVFGNCVMAACLGGAFILMFRRFASPVGIMMLAAGTTLGAVFVGLSVIFCGILLGLSNCDPDDDGNGCTYTDNEAWRMIPMYDQKFRFEPHLTPMVKPGWAYYIAILGAMLGGACALLLWIEAFKTNNNVTRIRYQQLQTDKDPYEGDIDPTTGQKYVYAQPQRYGVGVYGMQPVVAPHGAYQQYPPTSYAPQNVGFVPQNVGFAPQNVSFQQDMSRRAPSAPSDSGSSGVVTREINL